MGTMRCSLQDTMHTLGWLTCVQVDVIGVVRDGPQHRPLLLISISTQDAQGDITVRPEDDTIKPEGLPLVSG
jgi:hypothetical protein